MILVDANILMYAAGTPHRNKIPSLKFLHDVARSEYECCVNTEILQEILHRYRAINLWTKGREVYHLAQKIIPNVLPITKQIIDKTVELLNIYPGLMVRDCIHAAHCILANFEAICSFDTDFDRVSDIRRIEPRL